MSVQTTVMRRTILALHDRKVRNNLEAEYPLWSKQDWNILWRSISMASRGSRKSLSCHTPRGESADLHVLGGLPASLHIWWAASAAEELMITLSGPGPREGGEGRGEVYPINRKGGHEQPRAHV